MRPSYPARDAPRMPARLDSPAMDDQQPVQERYAPHSVCYGCGPANPDGLHLRSFEVGDELVADWQPSACARGVLGRAERRHLRPDPGLPRQLGRDPGPDAGSVARIDRRPRSPPNYEVQLLRPTPTDRPLRLRARVRSIDGRRAVAEAEIVAGHEVTATFRGTFAAVGPGHPAFHRWDP